MDPLYTVSGFAVGFIVGLTGVGGGSLMTPLLVLLFGVSPAVAVGTDLLYASITKAGGSWVHARRGNVDWRIVGLLAAGSLPAAILTTVALRYFNFDTKTLSALITTTLGVALILTALALVFKERLRNYARRRLSHRPSWSQQKISVVTVITGVFLGIVVTVSSVGAGAVGTAALFFLYSRLSVTQIVGTDIVHAVPLTLVAGLGHASLGTVDWNLLISLLIGSLPGIYLGSHISSRIPESILRPTLAGMLILIGGKLVL
ncbi:MAG: sulfite exporter TauE/SafE family protein [Gammaproteobacteria bacterium]|nr:sulfite exporter TauE/SafE family protein [Gammaproteobacteria bacterium]